MAENSKIEWCDSTFNPWWQCRRVSPGCDNCYAATMAARFGYGWDGNDRRTFGDKHWAEPIKWAKTRFSECMGCGWRGPATKAGLRTGVPGFDRDPGAVRCCPTCNEPLIMEARMRVFCASMGDWLDLDAPLDDFLRLLDTVRMTPELDWQLLTKRIGNWRKRMAEAHARAADTEGSDMLLPRWIAAWLDGEAPRNAWLGATVVNQEEADRDIPKLLAAPARVRFLSIEPMLSAIDLTPHLWGKARPCADCPRDADCHCGYQPRNVLEGMDGEPALHWVICGGESGPHARPTHPDWVRSLRDQCAAAGANFLFKQWGEWAPGSKDFRSGAAISRDGAVVADGFDAAAYPKGSSSADGWAMVHRAGKRASGRLLDGVEHNEFPENA